MLWPVWSMDVNGTVCCAAYRSPNTELWSQPVGGFLGGFELAREHGSFNYIYSTMKYCIRCRNFSRSMITTWKEGKSGKVQIPKWKSGFQVSNILSSNPSNEMDMDICVKIPEPRAIVSFAVKRCMVIIPFREFPNDPNVDLSPTHKVPQS